ncbi:MULTISPECIES: aldehyde dehydrogenase [Mycobacterium]|uniref:Aldehyde dehydrogenase n=1 Tax=Mycobacterium kiyosense TaxID=2871094 RepID=A0A9P3UW64_9MYCO|nr:MULTISPECIES: aldehyde dehydrogenase [Mycobacterium]BDB44090.1 aldehyde dehydrogenase [Mycobacterium kiyosense]BDE15625.1 aldehyde dehydrogenase [Mycobacterium sp. 20KCMC460]GLB80952.1 aldehyde dehydrogenase [Mycobacterium kiyosense]GLB87288.1 aldehyde dehydrogenase [Mycobacterium kiyosense]GLB93432.1 aldehyde dehydrogenase [Mycobacterium kiyosense]
MSISLDRHSVFIGGTWVAASASTAEVLEAATGKVLGSVALAGTADVDAAVSAAAAALRGPWGATSGMERAELMRRMAASLQARAKDTAELVSRENGMPRRLSLGANGYFPSIALDYYAGLAQHIDDEDERPGALSHVTVRREPIGVVAAVIPWNYPMSLAAMKIAPALAAGCTIVLKPPPETALDAFAWAEAALEAGLPAGVLNVIPGGRESGAALISHPGVDKVAFTGSTAAGRAIGEICGRLLRPVTLELGGKSAAIIADDAELDAFVAALPDICLPNNGQTCHAATRILAPASRYAEIVDAVTDTVGALRIGDPLDKATQIGPMVSAAQRGRVLDYIETGRAGGARLTTGGGTPADQSVGWFVEPTVFADVDNAMTIAREEIFGPVLCVLPYADDDEAVAIANDSDYGLGGTVWTTDPERGATLAARMRTGSVGINHYALDVVGPFGGVKSSGVGRELGPEGLAPYVALKSVYRPPVRENR